MEPNKFFHCQLIQIVRVRRTWISKSELRRSDHSFLSEFGDKDGSEVPVRQADLKYFPSKIDELHKVGHRLGEFIFTII